MSNATRILLALVAGTVLGIATAGGAPALAKLLAEIADPIGALWLNGLRMTIVPLVVSLLITGIARTAEAARAGRLAATSLGGIAIMMTLSAAIGMVATPLVLAIVPLPAGASAALGAALGTSGPVATPPPFADTVKSLVPSNVIDAAARTDILPLLIFTLVFAFAVTRLEAEPRARITGFFAAIADALIIVVGWVLRLAPIGVFALAFVVGARSGMAVLGTLLHYVFVVSSVGLIVTLIAYPLAVIGGRQSLGNFVRALLPVQALAISTQSSLACLPIMLKKSEELGVPEPRAALILPMAVALMRATGPAMNVAVALYIANLVGVPVTPAHAVLGVVVATLASMGSVSLPGTITFFANIAPVCLALGIPIEPLALFLAIETFPDLVRTAGNVTIDVAMTTAVSRRADQ